MPGTTGPLFSAAARAAAWRARIEVTSEKPTQPVQTTAASTMLPISRLTLSLASLRSPSSPYRNADSSRARCVRTVSSRTVSRLLAIDLALRRPRQVARRQARRLGDPVRTERVQHLLQPLPARFPVGAEAEQDS